MDVQVIAYEAVDALNETHQTGEYALLDMVDYDRGSFHMFDGWWSGVTVRIRFNGQRVDLRVTDHAHDDWYEIDGAVDPQVIRTMIDRIA